MISENRQQRDEIALYVDPTTRKACGAAEIPFCARQSRTALAACGSLDPEDILEYTYLGGYESARRAFLELAPDAICEEMLAPGLRGRGGGFPTGK